MNLFKTIRFLWLAFWCPNFRKEMPKEGGRVGRWEVGAIVHSAFHNCEKGNTFINGTLRDAYIEARSIALHIDWATRSEELGVIWFIKEVK